MKGALISIVQLVTLLVSIGDAIGQQYEARHGGPSDDISGEGFSLASRRHDSDFSKSRRPYDTDFDAVRGAFQDTDETLRDQQSASGSRGRHNSVGGGGGGRHNIHDCSNSDITECVGLLEVLTNKDLGFAASLDELNKMCPVLLNGLQCIDNYTRRCLTLKHREYFNKLYAGTIRVIKDLCKSKGEYQLEYIRHAPCMRQVNPKYNKCSEVYHEKTADLNQVNEAVVQLSDEEKNKNVITLCCSFQEYLQCSEQVVYETCGNETALFTKKFLDRMAGPIVQDLCEAFSFSLHSCSQESSMSAKKTTEDSGEDTVLKTSTLSDLQFTTIPSVVTLTHVTTIKPITTPPGITELVHGDDYLVSEEDLTGHRSPVADPKDEENEQSDDSTSPVTFKCLNYAPGSQVCSAGPSVDAAAHITLTLVAASLFLFRWFLA